jgi:uncharacterized protein YggT (Ycf19 family)
MGFVLQLIYTLAAVTGMLYLAQAAVYVLSFGGHEGNPVYRVVRFLTNPVTKIVRRITPAKVGDRHVPVVAFFMLFWICLALALYLPKLAGVVK